MATVKIQPATRKTLGGVIVGNGFNVQEDGTLTVDEEQIKQAVGNDTVYVEFTRTRLEELFAESKQRRGR